MAYPAPTARGRPRKVPMGRAIRLAACIAIASAANAAAGELQDDLGARRARLMERLGPNALLVLWSAPVRTYSADVDYEYRQDSNLFYLTGIDQPETMLVLMPGNLRRKAILFIQGPSAMMEHWSGRRLTTQEATGLSGIETVHFTRDFEPFVNAMFTRRPFGLPRDDVSPEFGAFFTALEGGRAILALPLDPQRGVSRPLDQVLEFGNRLKERFVGFTVQDAWPHFRDLRQVKTPYERTLLARSVAISNEAHLAGMRAARPGAYEYEVKAAIEAVYRSRGALGWGFPSIVGSGPNATTLHYARSNRQMQAGELLLVDAAANYEYMTGDITRTYPVSGRFSALQRDVYEIVLAAQDAAMKVATAGAKRADVHQKTVEVIKEGLLRLGLITDLKGDQYRLWYTHNSVHAIGIDVHDVQDPDRPLEPGNAFVIEPGIYVRDGALESLPPTPENVALIAKVKPAFEKYRNIGVRVEDSYLLTERGLERLSASVPRTIEEIERFMQSNTGPVTNP